jgi:hypothetical protein
MKNNFIVVLIASFLSFSGFSQTSYCPNFSITGVYQDTIDPSMFQVSIEFTAPDSVFVGYTVISTVLDCNGDTIATGSPFWFGQIGQTTQDYPITLTGQPNCVPYTALFSYISELGSVDTCFLLYSPASIIENLERSAITINPNPATSQFSIQGLPDDFNGEMIILNQLGQVVHKSPFKESISVESLDNGCYFLKLSGKEKHYTAKFVKH